MSANLSLTVLSKIGEGGFGKVFKVVETAHPQMPMALKVMLKNKLSPKDIEHTKSEMTVLTSTNSPFIVRLIESFQTERGFFLLMEYVPGFELFDLLNSRQKLPLHQTKFFLTEIVVALDYLHGNSILYRDLKPENIMIELQGHIKLIDFGLCKIGVNGEVKASTYCGSVEHMAPEIIRREEYGLSVDLWALGIVAYDMSTGLNPFYLENLEMTKLRILTANFLFPTFLVSQDFKDLVTNLLMKRARERISLEEVKGHLPTKGRK